MPCNRNRWPSFEGRRFPTNRCELPPRELRYRPKLGAAWVEQPQESRKPFRRLLVVRLEPGQPQFASASLARHALPALARVVSFWSSHAPLSKTPDRHGPLSFLRGLLPRIQNSKLASACLLSKPKPADGSGLSVSFLSISLSIRSLAWHSIGLPATGHPRPQVNP